MFDDMQALFLCARFVCFMSLIICRILWFLTRNCKKKLNITFCYTYTNGSFVKIF